jgi:hypothetical protein
VVHHESPGSGSESGKQLEAKNAPEKNGTRT